ncbi:MAG: phenylalanine--tRNA ligase subunit alpha [Patescibacteria group bacterium]|nr:phenylalanine--tRNA ligase subunit alpha [Patescibacteria group bacterium]
MKNKIEEIKNKIFFELKEIKESDALKDLEMQYIGRKGEFTSLLKKISSLSDAEKREIGQIANLAKTEIFFAFKKTKKIILNENNNEFIDLSLPGEKRAEGHLNPISLVSMELEELFVSMGFMVLDGPELESEYYNFEALNIPAHHPARDMQDTFFVSEDEKNRKGDGNDLVLRTHTSSVQIRAMQKHGAPIRCVAPGRVFRAEATDAVHEHTFYQMEGLMVGKDVNLSNLIAVMQDLINKMFDREVETRVRPGYFPFVEPGIELDIKCTICNGKKGGCPSCKHTTWLELLPAGMVHPNVLKAGKVDPKEYSGFAFGLGLTRLAMMKYGIGDIRHFNSGDLRFVGQF